MTDQALWRGTVLKLSWKPPPFVTGKALFRSRFLMVFPDRLEYYSRNPILSASTKCAVIHFSPNASVEILDADSPIPALAHEAGFSFVADGGDAAKAPTRLRTLGQVCRAGIVVHRCQMEGKVRSFVIGFPMEAPECYIKRYGLFQALAALLPVDGKPARLPLGAKKPTTGLGATPPTKAIDLPSNARPQPQHLGHVGVLTSAAHADSSPNSRRGTSADAPDSPAGGPTAAPGQGLLGRNVSQPTLSLALVASSLNVASAQTAKGAPPVNVRAAVGAVAAAMTRATPHAAGSVLVSPAVAVATAAAVQQHNKGVAVNAHAAPLGAAAPPGAQAKPGSPGRTKQEQYLLQVIAQAREKELREKTGDTAARKGSGAGKGQQA